MMRFISHPLVPASMTLRGYQGVKWQLHIEVKPVLGFKGYFQEQSAIS